MVDVASFVGTSSNPLLFSFLSCTGRESCPVYTGGSDLPLCGSIIEASVFLRAGSFGGGVIAADAEPRLVVEELLDLRVGSLGGEPGAGAVLVRRVGSGGGGGLFPALVVLSVPSPVLEMRGRGRVEMMGTDTLLRRRVGGGGRGAEGSEGLEPCWS